MTVKVGVVSLFGLVVLFVIAVGFTWRSIIYTRDLSGANIEVGKVCFRHFETQILGVVCFVGNSNGTTVGREGDSGAT